MVDRPSVRWTRLVLAAGTLLSFVGLIAASVLRALDQPSLADAIATAAVVVLIATPAVGLLTTWAELRRVQRPAALLALLVLAILGAATLLALVGSH